MNVLMLGAATLVSKAQDALRKLKWHPLTLQELCNSQMRLISQPENKLTDAYEQLLISSNA